MKLIQYYQNGSNEAQNSFDECEYIFRNNDFDYVSGYKCRFSEKTCV